MIAWLLARDRHLQPAHIVIEQHHELAAADEPLGGVPLCTWSFGTPVRGAYGIARFAAIAGRAQLRADYLWGALCGASCLLEQPHRRGPLRATALTMI